MKTLKLWIGLGNQGNQEATVFQLNAEIDLEIRTVRFSIGLDPLEILKDFIGLDLLEILNLENLDHPQMYQILPKIEVQEHQVRASKNKESKDKQTDKT
jgi:hypothetical protein